ncbi:MAG TPA: FAD-dependent oxidoreductase [Flavitalea sp.]|nr:FAD-dependent oxidoreductase [Flavitalea sp.]
MHHPIICFIFRPVYGSPQIDLIIVGQGLAGSAVAMRALARDYKILVLDEPAGNRSSRMAAGLFNPFTGRKMVKTWLADEIFPSLYLYYSEVEDLTKKRFFYDIPIYRPFGNIKEQNEWMAKSADSDYQNYISGLSATSGFNGKVNDPFGGITLKQTGYLDTQTYLEAVREYLEVRGSYRVQIFDADKLEIGDNWVRYENLTARKVVFCQGVQNTSNHWFRDLPLISLKGEFLTVQSEWKKDVILNRGVYMVPSAHPDTWRVGATYNRKDHRPEITSWARNELTHKLEELIRMPYAVTGQQWGVRPTTPDQKPIIGAHPKYDSLIIFNGLGTKGVSLAPYFSEVLIRWLEKKGTINKEADVTRFI